VPRRFRGFALLSMLLCWAVIFAPVLVGQKPMPRAKDHPEPSAGQRKALDELTQRVGPRLPAFPEIPVNRKNYIDDYILGKMKRDNIPHAGLSGASVINCW
jgi:hypothetical protein